MLSEPCLWSRHRDVYKQQSQGLFKGVCVPDVYDPRGPSSEHVHNTAVSKLLVSTGAACAGDESSTLLTT